MSLERKLKTALDETRLLILGAQVLFGFQFNGTFQEMFGQLPPGSRYLASAALVLLIITIGLLVGPSMQHRIAEGGKASSRMLALTTMFAGAALLPLSVGLSFDLFVAMQGISGPAAGAFSGAVFFLVSLFFWYGLELFAKRKGAPMTKPDSETAPKLSMQVEQLLTEARVVIPGAQALLGFQLTVTLTRAFEQLAHHTKMAHALALCCVALAIVLLMAPAALHRLCFGGEDDPTFLRTGSGFVIAAPFPLAMGIALDTYVAMTRSLESEAGAVFVAIMTTLVLFGLWYVYPLWRRFSARPPKGKDSRATGRGNLI